MIDPTKITNFQATDYELQELILFWILAANKNGRVAAKQLDRLLDYTLSAINLDICLKHAPPVTPFPKGFYKPFDLIKKYNRMTNNDWWLCSFMKQCGIGLNKKKSEGILQLVHSDIDLRKCSPEELEQIKQIGRKTSRCFIIHSRRNAWYAGLDTHAMKFLRDNGYPNAPKQPSSKKSYDYWQKIMLSFIPKGMTAAEWDLANWNKYSLKVQI